MSVMVPGPEGDIPDVVVATSLVNAWGSLSLQLGMWVDIVVDER